MSDTTKTVLKVAAVSLVTYAIVAYVQANLMAVPVVGNYLPKAH